MILEVLQHGGSCQLRIADLRRLNFDRLLRREIPRLACRGVTLGKRLKIQQAICLDL